MRAKFCPKCKQTKYADHFYVVKGKLSAYCKPCKIAQHKELFGSYKKKGV